MTNPLQENLVSSINPRAKRLSMRVDHRAGVIKLTIPKWTMQWQINRFLNANAHWIADKQATLSPNTTIQHGATIPFLGKDRTLVIEPHSKRTTEIEFTDNTITIQTSRPDPTSNLKRWIIEQAKQTIIPLAHAKASHIGKAISKIDFRDPTSRWGSCSTDARLMFSWRLIMSPPEILDYVVAHEVAHLTHMDHSQNFWDLCYDLTDGDADMARQWLKDNGNALMRYF